MSKELKDCKTQAEIQAWYECGPANEHGIDAALTRMAEVARLEGCIAGLQEAATCVETRRFMGLDQERRFLALEILALIQKESAHD